MSLAEVLDRLEISPKKREILTLNHTYLMPNRVETWAGRRRRKTAKAFLFRSVMMVEPSGPLMAFIEASMSSNCSAIIRFMRKARFFENNIIRIAASLVATGFLDCILELWTIIRNSIRHTLSPRSFMLCANSLGLISA